MENTKPEPKYKKGDWILTKSGRRGHIYEEPSWNDWSEWDGIQPQWMYDYDYYTNSLMGSEGSVIESDIERKVESKKE